LRWDSGRIIGKRRFCVKIESALPAKCDCAKCDKFLCWCTSPSVPAGDCSLGRRCPRSSRSPSPALAERDGEAVRSLSTLNFPPGSALDPRQRVAPSGLPLLARAGLIAPRPFLRKGTSSSISDFRFSGFGKRVFARLQSAKTSQDFAALDPPPCLSKTSCPVFPQKSDGSR
jgi:hypothetical protein